MCVDNNRSVISILGLGSLISEKSARTTFPNLRNFRLGRVHDHRRVFSHPAATFFEHGIAKLDTLEFACLSAEYAPGHSFLCSVFEVPGLGLPKLRKREAVYKIKTVSYEEIRMNDKTCSESDADPESCYSSEPTAGAENGHSSDRHNAELKHGLLCFRGSDSDYIERYGPEKFREKFEKWGLKTIWGWSKDSGIRPCAVYLKHCFLASKRLGEECHNSFLDETYLVDRKTTIRKYLEKSPHVLKAGVPHSLKERYGG